MTIYFRNTEENIKGHPFCLVHAKAGGANRCYFCPVAKCTRYFDGLKRVALDPQKPKEYEKAKTLLQNCLTRGKITIIHIFYEGGEQEWL